jgi:UDP-2,3-diacylglucosamine pyrophosphatase LpxH
MNSRKIPRRKPEIVIISDTHLGTYGCHAKELLMYLKSIDPKILILNGDIIDIWQFRKRYFPRSHMQVIRQLTTRISKGKKVIYVTGNHDEMLRKFVRIRIGSFELVNKLVLEIDGKKAWIFHGDVFDVTMQFSKWVTRLGSVGYGILILINSFINFLLVSFKREKISFSKKVKESVKTAVAFINRFEETAAGIAIRNRYDYMICGHIHQPVIRNIKTSSGEVQYLNSGDWVENLTSLEYQDGKWSVYRYREDPFPQIYKSVEKQPETLTNRELFHELLKEFNIHVTI